jgi:hypothetical protein
MNAIQYFDWGNIKKILININFKITGKGDYYKDLFDTDIRGVIYGDIHTENTIYLIRDDKPHYEKNIYKYDVNRISDVSYSQHFILDAKYRDFRGKKIVDDFRERVTFIDVRVYSKKEAEGYNLPIKYKKVSVFFKGQELRVPESISYDTKGIHIAFFVGKLVKDINGELFEIILE